MVARKTKSIAALVLATLIVAGIAAFCFLYMGMGLRVSNVSPSPVESASGGMDSAVSSEGDEWPEVDWEYWRGVNPNVIGWINVPGTDISYPICQAPASSPEYYLDHDVYGGYNVYGCPYLDADCAAAGFASRNAVIFGHHMNDGSMFAALAEYSNQSFMDEHRYICLQTPERKWKLRVAGAQVIRGSDALKRTEFSGDEDFKAYFQECLRASIATMDAGASSAAGSADAAPARMTTLCTCSYTMFGNDERTLVYAVED